MERNKGLLKLFVGVVFVGITLNWYLTNYSSRNVNSTVAEEKKVVIAPTGEVAANKGNDTEINNNSTDVKKVENVNTPTVTNTPTITPVQQDNASKQSNNPGTYNSEEKPKPAPEPDKKEQLPVQEKAKVPTKEELQNSIVSKYTSQFISLKNSSLSSLNSLMAQAMAEYTALPADKRAAGKVTLGLKYLGLGKSLESESDTKFYGLLTQMEQELKSNELTTGAVDDAKARYNSEKAERRNYLISKAFN